MTAIRVALVAILLLAGCGSIKVQPETLVLSLHPRGAVRASPPEPVTQGRVYSEALTPAEIAERAKASQPIVLPGESLPEGPLVRVHATVRRVSLIGMQSQSISNENTEVLLVLRPGESIPQHPLVERVRVRYRREPTTAPQPRKGEAYELLFRPDGEFVGVAGACW